MDPAPCSGDASNSNLRCTQCAASFEDVLALLSHLDSHASRCPICNKEFTSKQFLDHHMKSHLPPSAGDLQTPSANGTMEGENENVETTGHAEDIPTQSSVESEGHVDEDQISNAKKETNPVNLENKEAIAKEQEDGDEQVEEVSGAKLEKNTPVTEITGALREPNTKPAVAEECGEITKAEDMVEKFNVDKPRVDKPFHCSKCKYAAKCVAIVNMHQRRQHPGEWTTVISSINNTEVKQKNEDSPLDKQKESLADSDDDGSADEEVRKALQSPLPESESEEEDEEKEYKCSMCDFTAKNTDTVFEHQQDQHPSEWQLTSGIGTPDHKEGVIGVSGEEEMESSAVPFYELPTELDHFSSMGRSIIAGNVGSDETSTYILDSRGYNAATGKFHCTNCPAYFYEQGHIRRHLQTCLSAEGVNPASVSHYRCRLCKRMFPDMGTLLPHMANHQKNYPCYRCTLCGYKGKFEGTIIAHIHHRHPQGPEASVEQIANKEDIERVPTWWDLVGPGRDGRSDLEVIGEAETDDPDLQRLFGIATANQSRDSTPQGSSPPESLPDVDTQSQCSEMSDETIFDPNQWTLEAIVNLKVGNNYMCPECPVLFHEPYKLKRHLDTHAGVKRHICKICGKRFTRSEHLKRHRVVHANTKPYMCSICCYSSKRLDNLQKHQRVKHPGDPCEIVRVSKEMIEAEIAANERAQSIILSQPPIIPRPQLAVLPQPPQALIIPPTKAKRGRPRKISSPEDNFVFSRDPNYTTPTANFPTPTCLGNSLLEMNQQSSNGMPLNSLPGALNLNYSTGGGNSVYYNSPQPSTSFYPHPNPMFVPPNLSSTPMQMPTFDLSRISAAAVSAVMAPLVSNQNVMGIDSGESNKHMPNLAEKSSMASDTETNPHNIQSSSNNTVSGDTESNKISLAALVNRGKYQCHVCDRPFSYLKPFKKHLLCHGTFMPYECSVCGHQSKRRDMMQDHQREAHQGVPCEIRVKEPTSDMHDMMDTYIQQVPDQRQNLPDSQTPSAMHPAVQAGSETSSLLAPPRNPCSNQIFPGGPGSIITAMDRSMVDPQVNLNLALDLVKVEPLDSVPIPVPSPTLQSETIPNPLHGKSKQLVGSSHIVRTRSKFSRLSSNSPLTGISKAVNTRSAVQNQKVKAVQKITDAVVKSERTTSSPVIFSTFSPQSPTVGTGLVRPRPRRANLIKFKVLSPHTKPANKPPAALLAKTDGEDDTNSSLAYLPKEEEPIDTSIKESSNSQIKPAPLEVKKNKDKAIAEKKKVEEDATTTQNAPPVKRRRMSERKGNNQPTTSQSEMREKKEKKKNSVQPVERSMIGTAPKVPIMGLKAGKPLPVSSIMQKALVIDIKSHKGSPKDKQGDNHRFVCSVCDQRFAYEKPFKRHLLVHGGFEPYKCNACGHHTTSRDSMKVHQHKAHMNQKGLGITVLNPTPEMEQSLIEQGLLQQHVEGSSDDEEDPANKSIVETARMEQHKMAAAIKTLSATVKKQSTEKKKQEDEKEEEQPSFPLMLGLRPANSNSTKVKEIDTNEEGVETAEEAGDDLGHQIKEDDGAVVGTHDDISDLPVDDAIFDPQGASEGIGDSQSGVTFPCQFCNKIYHCSSKLQRHLVSHTGIKAYECQICFKKLTRLEHLKRHLLTHGNIKPYRCSVCKFDAKRLDIVQLHQQMTHLGEEVDIVYLFTPSVMVPDSDTCLEDGASEKGQHGCATCGLMFVTVNHLMAHQKTHTNQKPYECFICQKTFTRPEHLKRHRLVHDDTKPYRCSECGFKTKRLDGMREHQRSRHPTSTEAFIIDTILPENPTVKRKRGRPPKFGPRDSLDGLQLLHCDKCCLAFYDQTRFDQHKIMHIPSPVKPQDLTCRICGIRVSQAKHLRRHMLLHENHVPYQCSLCGYTAKRTDHMQLHFRKQHPEGDARMIHIAKDGTSTDASTSFMLSDDSANEGSSSIGNDSYFESYSVDDFTETSLTLEQLNQMAEVSEDEEAEMDEDGISEEMEASKEMKGTSLTLLKGNKASDTGIAVDGVNVQDAGGARVSKQTDMASKESNSEGSQDNIAVSAAEKAGDTGETKKQAKQPAEAESKSVNIDSKMDDICEDQKEKAAPDGCTQVTQE